MRTIAVANQKGGKSTLAVHLVWLARELGLPTMLVDLDGQANSTRTFLATPDPAALSASHLFALDAGATTALPARVDAGTWLIPADLEVNDLEALPLDVVCRPVEHLGRIAVQSSAVGQGEQRAGR